VGSITTLYQKLKTPTGYCPPESFIDPARPLSALHRAELLEEMERLGITPPDRRLVESDYYGVFGRLLTDVWVGSKRHEEWLKSNQHLVDKLKENPPPLSRTTAGSGPDGPPTGEHEQQEGRPPRPRQEPGQET
jgi:hypothetical protein